MKLLLDTDIGSDIDDAICLAYLLAQPKCELLGITTVSGEPVKRAMLASAHLPGMTYFTKEDGGPHEVAMQVDTAQFFREYFGVTATG